MSQTLNAIGVLIISGLQLSPVVPGLPATTQPVFDQNGRGPLQDIQEYRDLNTGDCIPGGGGC